MEAKSKVWTVRESVHKFRVRSTTHADFNISGAGPFPETIGQFPMFKGISLVFIEAIDEEAKTMLGESPFADQFVEGCFDFCNSK